MKLTDISIKNSPGEHYQWIITYSLGWDNLFVHTTIFESEARQIAINAINNGMNYVTLARTQLPVKNV